MSHFDWTKAEDFLIEIHQNQINTVAGRLSFGIECKVTKSNSHLFT